MALMKQVFKTLAGAQKRVAFKNAHSTSDFRYQHVRCVGPYSRRDEQEYDPDKTYTWRIEIIKQA